MEDSNVAVLAILDNQTSPYKADLTMGNYSNTSHEMPTEDTTDPNETHKQTVIWSRNATLMLINLYETKMNMMDNPKKKTKMWTSISEELKPFNIEVTADQVRWKINALTKKYKDCLEKGQGPMSFKYFNEMHQILGRYTDDSDTYRLASGIMQRHQDVEGDQISMKQKFSFKTSAPFRKLRAERKAKIELDKQWIEYLKRQDEQKQIRIERHERNLRLREEEIQLRKKELEIKQAISLKKLQLRERKQEELLKIEREKCLLLKQLVADP